MSELYHKTSAVKTPKYIADEMCQMFSQKSRRVEHFNKTYSYLKIITLLKSRQPWSLDYLLTFFQDYCTRITVVEAIPIFEYFYNEFLHNLVGVPFQMITAEYLLDRYNLNDLDCIFPIVKQNYYYPRHTMNIQPGNCLEALNWWRVNVSANLCKVVYPVSVHWMYQYGVSTIWIMGRIRRQDSGQGFPREIAKYITSLLNVEDWAIDNFQVIRDYNF